MENFVLFNSFNFFSLIVLAILYIHIVLYKKSLVKGFMGSFFGASTRYYWLVSWWKSKYPYFFKLYY